jgi:hypothetical protein
VLKISISSELADAHPRFMAGCAERGHRVEVFESGGSSEAPRELRSARSQSERLSEPRDQERPTLTGGREYRPSERSELPGRGRRSHQRVP